MENQIIVLYDWDGTLIDSLPAHIKFLREMNKRFKWGLDLPDPRDKGASKKIVGSPMKEFLINAGISPDVVPEIVRIYEKEFSDLKYHSELFPGVPGMIRRFSEMSIPQGILTSNYKKNMDRVLKKEGIYNLIYPVADKRELDRFHDGKKARWLEHHKIMNSFLKKEMIYVGDMKADYEESKKAEVSFIGASHGWGFSPEEKTDFPLANSIGELEEAIMQFVKS